MTDVELVKSKIDIVSLISEHVPLKKSGRNFAARCPFHSEKTPSFFVSPERQSWHCFGACNEGGDVITFVQKQENVEFVEALKILAQKAGVTLTKTQSSDTSRVREKFYEINHLASEFYHYLLTAHKMGERAREYLAKRGIKKESVNTFTLGYAPASWDSLSKYLVKKGYQPRDLAQVGLVVSKTNGGLYDRFRGRLIFTLRDHRGNVVGFSGRVLPEKDEKSLSSDRQDAKYINTNETLIYVKGNTLYGLDVTKDAVKREKEVVVVEGEFDLLASWQSGVPNVVAIKGSALTQGQLLLLKRFTDKLLLALDSDFAGNEAARRGIEAAEVAGFSVQVITPMYGKDPAECVAKAPHLWKESVEKAEPLYDFVISQAVKRYEKEGILGKKKIAEEVIPFLSSIENPIVLSHYIRRVSTLLSVSEESVTTAVSRFGRKTASQERIIQKPTKTSRLQLLEEHLLALIIQSNNSKDALTDVVQIVSLSDFEVSPVTKILELLVGYFVKHKTLDAGKFGNLLVSELVPTFDRAYLLDLSTLEKDQILWKKELLKAAREIKKVSLRRKLSEYTTNHKHAEDNKDGPDSQKLQFQMKELLAQLGALEKEG